MKEASSRPPVAAQVQEQQEAAAARRQLAKSRSRSLLTLIDALGAVELHASVPHDIVRSVPVVGRGAVVNAADVPTPTNCDELHHYFTTLNALLGNTPAWKRKAELMRSVCEWSLHLCTVQHQKLRLARHPSVLKKSRSEWLWAILKRIHYIKDDKPKNALVLNLLGDYHRLSLNPSGRTFKPRAAPLIGESESFAPKEGPVAPMAAASQADIDRVEARRRLITGIKKNVAKEVADQDCKRLRIL